MEFLELMRERYSVRRFDRERKVEKEKIEQILEAARLSPSAHNFQSRRVLVLQSGEALAALKECTLCHYHAPLAFIVSYDKEACWKRDADEEPAGVIDASIAATHMMLAAYELGVGGVWVMGFDKEALRERFCIPETLVPVMIFVCGYPSADVRPSSRHGQRQRPEEFVSYNKYEAQGGEEE